MCNKRAFIYLLLVSAVAAACSQTQPISNSITPETTITPSSFFPNTQTSSPQITSKATDILITSTIEPTATATITITTESTQMSPSIPEEFFITNISGRKQHFPLGCEASASADLAAFYGLTINEFEFQHKLPLSDNPELGFVGSVNSPWGQIPPYGYGVHAAPVAALLNDYGLPAQAFKNYTLEQVKAQLANGNPIIAWVIGNMVGGIPAEYTDKEGNKVVVAAYEHVVILTGYSKDRIRYMNNGRFFEVPYDVFLNSWGVLENMVVIANIQP